MLKDVALLCSRLALSGYVGVHGLQKLTGAFDGPGLDKAGDSFAAMGLEPGRTYAQVAGATELGGAVLTAFGVLDPLGPMAVVGAMAVAATSKREQGPLAQSGGYELPALYAIAAATLAAAGPGTMRIGPRLPKGLRLLVWAGTGASAAAMAVKMTSAKPA